MEIPERDNSGKDGRKLFKEIRSEIWTVWMKKRPHLDISLWNFEDTKYKEKFLKKILKRKKVKPTKEWGPMKHQTTHQSHWTPQAEEFFQRTRGHCFPIGILYPQEL